MKLSELKSMPVENLNSLGESTGLENVSRMKRQDVIFGILKNKAKEGEDIEGGGVLEILQDGFGFLRSPDSSYLAGPDDIYVSPSQIRRFGLRTGDTILGKIGKHLFAGHLTKEYIQIYIYIFLSENRTPPFRILAYSSLFIEIRLNLC